VTATGGTRTVHLSKHASEAVDGNERNDAHPNSRISSSVFSSQNRMSMGKGFTTKSRLSVSSIQGVVSPKSVSCRSDFQSRGKGEQGERQTQG
jgi:hypothetical protein